MVSAGSRLVERTHVNKCCLFKLACCLATLTREALRLQFPCTSLVLDASDVHRHLDLPARDEACPPVVRVSLLREDFPKVLPSSYS